MPNNLPYQVRVLQYQIQNTSVYCFIIITHLYKSKKPKFYNSILYSIRNTVADAFAFTFAFAFAVALSCPFAPQFIMRKDFRCISKRQL